MANDREVLIGEAAGLYGLAPSTVRWWERLGVLNPPARAGGKRVYRDADLRRIGIAYLCCMVGKMPLDQAAVVTSGKTTRDAWQRTVGEQIDQLGQQIAQLETARSYLRHLLNCEDDDMARCRYLEGELLARTPRGRIAETDLVTAARTAHQDEQPRGKAPHRDENPADHPSRDETAEHCLACARPMTRAPRGRPRKYCSRACRQRAYRARAADRDR
ncbi:MerR family transcriptional regulator [Actinomadura litoris]|uniref:MerR family transcriptional regulator n=1 Tax=Actinomadura litoris TaxID=2678616 RepID=UPI001FA6ADB1|nr:MerR family transcriptional regulator [Actinomadura litoris]